MKPFLSDLLNLSLQQTSLNATLQTLDITNYYREKKLLSEGVTSLMVRLGTPQRDQQFRRVNIGLTDGMIGHRILLVSEQNKYKFKDVNNLDSLRRLSMTGVFGPGWFDADIWRANNLSYVELGGGIETILRMLASGSRGIVYFSRGIMEIDEAVMVDGIAIEPQLLLVYDADFYIYTRKEADCLATTLLKALRHIANQGTLKRLQDKYFGYLYQQFKVEQRKTINLKLP